MFKKIKSYLSKNEVLVVSTTICLILIILCFIFNDSVSSVSNAMLKFLNNNFSWFYLLALPLIFLFLIFLACSKYGNVKLGGKDCKPNHSLFSWLAMLFCGGTGIGLVFWSIAEPLSHYANPYGNITPGSEEAASFSIRTAFMHWGLLPWACFTIVGLGIAYFMYNKRMSCKVSNIFVPMIGKKQVDGAFGKIIDIFSILVSVAGVATSLGLGCMQISGGMNYIFGIPSNSITWMIIIIVISCIFLISAATGVNKGIKILSNINTYLALLLLVIAFCIGPSSKTMNVLVNGIGDHISNFISDSFSINPWGDNSWVLNWRVFYWAWWVAWAPFVGMFIAKISKGRTIREFIIAAMIIPSLFTFIWFSTFGTLALSAVENWSVEYINSIASKPETAVFVIFEQYPISKILSVLVILLLAIFFITSADSATLSLSIMSSNGDDNPSFTKKLIWTIIEASMAFVLLLAGSLKPLQTISIVAALPFLIIMCFMCISILKELKKEFKNNKTK